MQIWHRSKHIIGMQMWHQNQLMKNPKHTTGIKISQATIGIMVNGIPIGTTTNDSYIAIGITGTRIKDNNTTGTIPIKGHIITTPVRIGSGPRPLNRLAASNVHAHFMF